MWILSYFYPSFTGRFSRAYNEESWYHIEDGWMALINSAEGRDGVLVWLLRIHPSYIARYHQINSSNVSALCKYAVCTNNKVTFAPYINIDRRAWVQSHDKSVSETAMTQPK